VHHVPESSIGEKCKCGNPAKHKVEEVFDVDDTKEFTWEITSKYRHPLTTYLCCQCFSLLMGDPFNWCGLSHAIE